MLSPTTLEPTDFSITNPIPVIANNWIIINKILNSGLSSSDPLYQIALRALLKNANVDATKWTTPIRGVSSSVDLTAVAATNVLTNNFGKDFIIDAIDILPVTVTAVTVQPTFRVTRSTGGADDYVASVTPPAITAAQFHRLTLKSFPLPRLESGASLRIDVTTGATATAYTAKIVVLGTIIP